MNGMKFFFSTLAQHYNQVILSVIINRSIIMAEVVRIMRFAVDLVCWPKTIVKVVLTIVKDDMGERKVEDALLNNQMHLGIMVFDRFRMFIYKYIFICVLSACGEM